MFDVDHVPVWLADRDGVLDQLASATGQPILDGYAPDGRRVARGLRFGNGPFLDLHQAETDGWALLALTGSVREAQAIAAQCGWKARLTPHVPGGEPWSILSFARGQGLLSALFVIEYATDAAAWTSPVYNGGLYHHPRGAGVALTAVRLTTSDRSRADRDLRSLGFRPGAGGRYVGTKADLVLADGRDAVVGVDIEGAGPCRPVALGPTLTAWVGVDSSGLTSR